MELFHLNALYYNEIVPILDQVRDDFDYQDLPKTIDKLRQVEFESAVVNLLLQFASSLHFLDVKNKIHIDFWHTNIINILCVLCVIYSIEFETSVDCFPYSVWYIHNRIDEIRKTDSFHEYLFRRIEMHNNFVDAFME